MPIETRPNRRFGGWLPVAVALAALLAVAPVALAQPPAIDCYSQLLGSSQFGEYFVVDLFTGAGSSIASMTPGLATEIEFDLLTDTLWAEEVNGLTDLHVIDSITGATLSRVTHAPGALTGLEFAGDTLYGTFISSLGGLSDLVIVDTTTGALTTVGPTGFGPISGLAYDTVGTMYGITAGGAPADLVTIDLGSGAATLVGPTGLDFIGSIEFGPAGFLYGGLTAFATTYDQFLVEIDPATGAATPIGDTGFSITGLTACDDPWVIAPAAEIPTLSGFGLALMALVLGVASLRRLGRRGTG